MCGFGVHVGCGGREHGLGLGLGGGHGALGAAED